MPRVKKEYDLVLTDRIEKAWENDELVSAFITGKRRTGKSAYALKAAQGFFYRQGHSFEEAWEKALDSLYFEFDEVVNVLDRYSEKIGERIPIIIWDDVGVHANKYRYFTKMKETELLKGLMDVLGTCTAAFLMTTPRSKGVLKFLQEYDNYKAEIYKGPGGADGYRRKAIGYNKYTLPSGTQRVAKDWEDHYSCFVPNEYYERYAPKREELAQKVVREIKATIKEQEKEPEDELPNQL